MVVKQFRGMASLLHSGSITTKVSSGLTGFTGFTSQNLLFRFPRSSFSTTPAGTGEEKPRRSFGQWKSDQVRDWPKTKSSMAGYATLGALGFSLYLLTKLGFYTVDFMATTSFYDVATTAFITGMVTAGACGVVLSQGAKVFTLRPENVYQEAVKKVLADERIVAALGDNVKSGEFRAYTITQGGFNFSPDKENADSYGWERWFKPRKIQMLFALNGSKENGMISVEAQKLFNGNYQFNFVTLDVINTNEHKVLEGSEASRIYRGVTRLR